jgi:hypothetical protein
MAGVQVSTAQAGFNAGEGMVSIDCPVGKIALSGGVQLFFSIGGASTFFVGYSLAKLDSSNMPVGWQAWLVNNSGGTASYRIQVICANAGP